MTLLKGDMQAVGTFGLWTTDESGASAPGRPSISVSSDGDGDAVTVTVSGDAGATHTLYYREHNAASWTEGNNRSGDGDIAQAGLDDHTWYEFQVVSDDTGVYSLPSLSYLVLVTSGAGDAVGVLAAPLETLRRMVAASATFQSWTSSANATEAKTHVHLVAITDASAARPFAIVRYAEDADHREDASAWGATQLFIDQGSIELGFEADVADGDADSHEDAELAFVNDIGQIMEDVNDIAGTDDYLILRGWEVVRGPARAHPSEEHSEGDYYQILLTVEYGLTPGGG